MSQQHVQHLVPVVGDGVGDRRRRHAQRHATLEPGRLARVHGRLEVMSDRVADPARDVRPSSAVQQHLDDGGVAELAGEVQRRRTYSGVEVETAAGDQHRRHLRLVADDDPLQDVPAAVVQHFQDVVSSRTPTEQCLNTQ